MSQSFYIVVNGQKTGPFTLDELKFKDITKETLVWTEGLDNWTKADHLPLLKDILRSIPPAVPGNTPNNSGTSQKIPPPPTPTSNTQTSGKYFGYELANGFQRFWANLINAIFFTIIILILGGVREGDAYSLDLIIIETIMAAIAGAIFYSLWSGNIGHKVLGIKVISSVDGRDQNKAVNGAIREGLKNIFSLIIIPCIWLLWDNDNQNLYDKVLKTYVVKKKASIVKKIFKTLFALVFTAILIIGFLISFSFFMYTAGIPKVSDYYVKKFVPTEVDDEMGRKILNEISPEGIDNEKSLLLQSFFHELGLNDTTRLFVLKVKEFNAFAIPGNNIVVLQGALEDVNSYEELAAVLAHEYSHVKDRHGIRAEAHEKLRNLIFSGNNGSDEFIKASNEFLLSKKSRSFEYQADQEGIEMLRNSNIDQKGFLNMLNVIQDLESLDKNLKTENKLWVNYFNSHPKTSDRISRIEENITDNPHGFEYSAKLDSLFKEMRK